MPMPEKREVNIKKVYSKQSHTQKSEHHYSPAYSTGTFNKKSFDVTIHLTPEVRNRPQIRKALIRHETREAYLIAAGKPKSQAHRQARRLDPQYTKRGGSWWDRLGHKGEFQNV
jgi:hypothetical protein